MTQNQKLLKDIYIFANKKKSLKFFIVPQKQRALIFLYFMEQSQSINNSKDFIVIQKLKYLNWNIFIYLSEKIFSSKQHWSVFVFPYPEIWRQ